MDSREEQGDEDSRHQRGECCGQAVEPAARNGGNCISLALNQGYGWAADVNLGFIFDRLFSVERGSGYPPNRREPQAASRRMLESLSRLAHKSFAQIVSDLPEEALRPVLEYPGVRQILDPDSVKDAELRAALKRRS